MNNCEILYELKGSLNTNIMTRHAMVSALKFNGLSDITINNNLIAVRADAIDSNNEKLPLVCSPIEVNNFTSLLGHEDKIKNRIIITGNNLQAYLGENTPRSLISYITDYAMGDRLDYRITNDYIITNNNCSCNNIYSSVFNVDPFMGSEFIYRTTSFEETLHCVYLNNTISKESGYNKLLGSVMLSTNIFEGFAVGVIDGVDFTDKNEFLDSTIRVSNNLFIPKE